MNVSIVLISVGLSIYAIETVAEATRTTNSPSEIATRMGLPVDPRTTREVLRDLSASGVENVYPNVFPLLYSAMNGLTVSGRGLYPLGGVSNVTTVFPNLLGFSPIVETDEYGFNNPRGTFGRHKGGVLLIGDSLTEGISVHSSKTIASQLRARSVDLVNLGKGGDGPLTEYATLREYGPALRPKVVLWVFFPGNDMQDLRAELNVPTLRRYLQEEDFSQKLIERQSEIDTALRHFVEQVAIPQSDREDFEGRHLVRILKLRNLRYSISALSSARAAQSLALPFEEFEEILRKSQQLVATWGGELYFVNLASITKYKTGKAEVGRDLVLPVVRQVGLPVIDIERDVFDRDEDPLRLFSLRTFSHYNAEGYRLVAEEIAARLAADGVAERDGGG